MKKLFTLLALVLSLSTQAQINPEIFPTGPGKPEGMYFYTQTAGTPQKYLADSIAAINQHWKVDNGVLQNLDTTVYFVIKNEKAIFGNFLFNDTIEVSGLFYVDHQNEFNFGFIPSTNESFIYNKGSIILSTSNNSTNPKENNKIILDVDTSISIKTNELIIITKDITSKPFYDISLSSNQSLTKKQLFEQIVIRSNRFINVSDVKTTHIYVGDLVDTISIHLPAPATYQYGDIITISAHNISLNTFNLDVVGDTIYSITGTGFLSYILLPIGVSGEWILYNKMTN